MDQNDLKHYNLNYCLQTNIYITASSNLVEVPSSWEALDLRRSEPNQVLFDVAASINNGLQLNRKYGLVSLCGANYLPVWP